MESLNFVEKKILLAQMILAITDTDKITRISNYLNKMISEKNEKLTSDSERLSFSVWNKQFENINKPDEYLAEYSMNLEEFRMKIFNAEKEQGMSKEIFTEKVKNWK